MDSLRDVAAMPFYLLASAFEWLGDLISGIPAPRVHPDGNVIDAEHPRSTI